MQQNVRTLYIIPRSITYKPTPANKFNRSCVGGGRPGRERIGLCDFGCSMDGAKPHVVEVCRAGLLELV